MKQKIPCVVIVESDILIRHPLAEYLRECGYRVLQAASTDEARKLFIQRRRRIAIDSILLDIAAPGGENAFALARWIRHNQPTVQVILAGTLEAVTEKAGELCENGPPLSKPYDHQLVADRIRRLLAARDRTDVPP
jgi:DNA-binding response OmpR family regulator